MVNCERIPKNNVIAHIRWPCPSLQANVFSDVYLKFNVHSMCRARYIYVEAATFNHYRLTDNCYVFTEIFTNIIVMFLYKLYCSTY